MVFEVKTRVMSHGQEGRLAPALIERHSISGGKPPFPTMRHSVQSGEALCENYLSNKLGTRKLYSNIFKDHLTNPRNVGELTEANASAEETNPVCGDRLCLYLRVSEGRVEAARFLAYGCPPTLACGSALTEMLDGLSIAEAKRISRKDLVDAVGGLPARKQHAAALAIETLMAALESY